MAILKNWYFGQILEKILSPATPQKFLYSIVNLASSLQDLTTQDGDSINDLWFAAWIACLVPPLFCLLYKVQKQKAFAPCRKCCINTTATTETSLMLHCLLGHHFHFSPFVSVCNVLVLALSSRLFATAIAIRLNLTIFYYMVNFLCNIGFLACGCTLY